MPIDEPTGDFGTGKIQVVTAFVTRAAATTIRARLGSDAQPGMDLPGQDRARCDRSRGDGN